MAYTTINKSSEHFNTKLWTGTGSSNALTGVGFQPDWTWIKNRTDANSHVLQDAVRGVGNTIISNNTDAQSAEGAGDLTAFGSDGFTVGTNGRVNGSGNSMVAWNWKANGAGSANTDGDINSIVSANTTAGFSIVKYTGNGSNDQRIGHGLGARPTWWMIKRLGSADDWIVYHQGLSSNWYDDTYLYLNSSNSVMGSVNTGTGNPTSSVFYIGDTGRTGANGDDYIAYVFAEKTGYSKFGSYVGNGNADGTFVYTGFKPAFIIVKPISGAEHWTMFDNKRLGYNPDNNQLYPNLNSPDATDDELDILSNGFKIRSTTGRLNTSGVSHIYMAFAEAPLVGTNNVPANAR